MAKKILPTITEELTTIAKAFKIIRVRATQIADNGTHPQSQESYKGLLKTLKDTENHTLAPIWMFFEAMRIVEGGKCSEKPDYVNKLLAESNDND